jgi:hypothetical protein
MAWRDPQSMLLVAWGLYNAVCRCYCEGGEVLPEAARLSMTHVHARTVLLSVFAVGALVCGGRNDGAEAANALKSGPSSKVILEVVNRHFTVGKKIPSIYLRVSSDGTAECHTEKYWDEPDIVKTKVLGRDDLEWLKVLLEQSELLGIKHRYERMYPVVDSWMEWNIKIDGGGEVQIIEVAGFSPAAAKLRNQPYPDVLVKLGCSIWKLRGDVFGDEQATRAYQSEECNAALGVH